LIDERQVAGQLVPQNSKSAICNGHFLAPARHFPQSRNFADDLTTQDSEVDHLARGQPTSTLQQLTAAVQVLQGGQWAGNGRRTGTCSGAQKPDTSAA
jgi:hypothetical protein